MSVYRTIGPLVYKSKDFFSDTDAGLGENVSVTCIKEQPSYYTLIPLYS